MKSWKTLPQKTDNYVLDGVSLLHRATWKTGDSYGTIAESYADITVCRYGLATVVFDGYSGPSIKDNTHQWRARVVHFIAETEFVGEKDDFMSRASNKHRLIELMTYELKNKWCSVINASGDADVDIVKTLVESSHSQSTTMIGEDTDLLILSLHYADTHAKDLYYRSDKAEVTQVYDITELKTILEKDLCTQLLFIHAFTGCDATSRIFGVGKKTAFQKIVQGDPTVKQRANTFILQN